MWGRIALEKGGRGGEHHVNNHPRKKRGSRGNPILHGYYKGYRIRMGMRGGKIALKKREGEFYF